MPSGITQTDVWQAADALLMEGARPTIERIRQKVGRGSPNTVGPHLEAWFKSLGPRIKDPGAFSASPALPDPITQAARHLWETALATARAEQTERGQEQRRQLDAERIALDRRANEVQQLHDRLANRERDLEEGILVARQQATAAEQRYASAEVKLHEREKQVLQLQERLTDVQSALHEQAERAERTRQEHVTHLSAAEARHTAHERRWMTALDAERSAVKRLETEQARASREAEQSAKMLREAAEQIKAHERELKQLNDRLGTQAQRHVTETGQLETRLDQQIKAAEKRALRAEAALDQHQQGAQLRERDLQAGLETSQGQVSKLLEQLASKDEALAAVNRLLEKRRSEPRT